MTIGKDIGLDHHRLVPGPLQGETARVDGWLDCLNDDSSPSRVVLHIASSSPGTF